MANISRFTDFFTAACTSGVGRPDVAQEHILAGLVLAERLRQEIDIHAAGQRVRHHQRRRRQIVRLHQRIHAAFEIAIAGEHARPRSDFPCVTAAATSSGSGPLLPMQVVQP